MATVTWERVELAMATVTITVTFAIATTGTPTGHPVRASATLHKPSCLVSPRLYPIPHV
jgi:hypothetical protein